MAQVDLAERVGLVSLHRLRAGGDVVVEVREDDRSISQHDRLDLTCVLPLIREGDRSEVLLDDPVERLVFVLRPVPDAAARDRRRQEDVRHRSVTPVGDADRGVQPRRVPVPRRRPGLRAGEVRRRRQDLERHVDPDLLHAALEDLRELRDLARLLGRQLDREALRVARLGHQLLRLRDVLVPLRDRLVRRRVHRRERRVVADVGEPVEQLLHDRGAVERQGHRLAHEVALDRVLQVDAEADLAVGRAPRREDLHLRVVEHRSAGGELHLVAQVDLATEEAGDHRRLVRVVRDVDAFQRRLAAPPSRVAVVLGADPRRVRGQLERTRRLRRGGEAAELVVLREDDRLVGGRARQIREARRRRVEREFDRIVVHLRDPARGEHAFERREGLRARVRVGEALERRDDVVGGEGAPFANLTFLRSANVHSLAVLFGFQESASSDLSVSDCVARVRNSPEMPPVSRPPWSANVCGSISLVGGGVMPTRMRPPTLRAAGAPNANGVSYAASAAPIAPTDSPRTVARFMNS